MAGHQETTAEADARVAAAKARLLALADDARPGHRLVVDASNLVRARPWQGVGLALLVGVALGLAPRETVRRLALLAAPTVRMLADVVPMAVFGAGAGGGARASAGVRRPR
jgi:hypothetical protein